MISAGEPIKRADERLFRAPACLWCASHLQGVGLSEESHPSDLYGDPDVDHLGRDVAQRQVADHHLLSLGGRGETHMLGGGVSGPG